MEIIAIHESSKKINIITTGKEEKDLKTSLESYYLQQGQFNVITNDKINDLTFTQVIQDASLNKRLLAEMTLFFGEELFPDVNSIKHRTYKYVYKLLYATFQSKEENIFILSYFEIGLLPSIQNKLIRFLFNSDREFNKAYILTQSDYMASSVRLLIDQEFLEGDDLMEYYYRKDKLWVLYE